MGRGFQDEFSAFVLRDRGDETESSSTSLPPFTRIEVVAFGLPKRIPLPSKQMNLPVPVKCCQAFHATSTNLVPGMVIQIPSVQDKDQESKEVDCHHEDFLELKKAVLRGIVDHLLRHHLLHPLFVDALREAVERDGSDRLIEFGGRFNGKALAALVCRGRAPGDSGLIVEWKFRGHVFDDWKFPIISNQQQPAERAWMAPLDWYTPQTPTVDSSGQ